LSPQDFVELFTADGDVTFAFHGYARAMHQILHGRSSPGRFHVHGFWEQGTTTTPFDMVVLNEMSRYHLAASAVQRSRSFAPGVPALLEHCQEMLARHHEYVREHLDDMPEVRDWVWS
jgi:xylulose-5-phosphate/fructose-6-phosphate phosphoketolase